ncbi:MAG TPA: hypothetical protein VFK48_09060 [Usitatibacter sp.]|nr:hypothetical protein [Usitatibacter sp.]
MGKDLESLERALLVALAALLPACMSMTPAQYMVSAESREVLRKYEGAKVRVARLAGPADFDAMCRGAGDVKAADGLSIPQFIEKSFNDEFRFAGIHSNDGVELAGTVTRLAFSSTAGLVNGWWEIGVALRSGSGASVSVEVRHDFHSGFDGVTACNNTSQALGTAVQALVRKTISDPAFAALVRR